MHLIEVKCIVTFSIYGSQNRKQRQAWEKHQFRISLPLFPRHFKKLVIAIALIIRILTCYSQVTKSFWNQSNSLHYLAFQSSPDFLLGWNRGGYIQIEVFCEQESEILRIGIPIDGGIFFCNLLSFIPVVQHCLLYGVLQIWRGLIESAGSAVVARARVELEAPALRHVGEPGEDQFVANIMLAQTITEKFVECLAMDLASLKSST